MSTPVLCHCGTCSMALGAEGIYCEVHKMKSIVPNKIICLARASSSVCGFWMRSDRAEWGNSFRAGWKNAVVKFRVIDMIQIEVFYSYQFKLKEIGQWVRCSWRGFTLFKDMNQYRFFKPVPVRAQQAGFPITQSKLFLVCALIWSCFLSLVTSVLT